MKERKIGQCAEKGFTPILYTWTPETSVKKNNKNIEPIVAAEFCTAKAGSEGGDYITTYCYDIIFNTKLNEFERLAYVECGYVE